MKYNQKSLGGDKELMNEIKDVEGITGLNRKWPVGKCFMTRPHKFVPNDAHIKTTAPGFARNCYGKPFFS